MVIFIETISLSDAFKYPFKDPKKLLYALLLLIPILGWLVLFGYIVRLVNEFIEGRYEEPLDLDLMEDLKLGAITFVKALPFYIVYAVVIFAINYISPNLGSLIELMLGFFVIPILAVNFFRKQTIESFFEFDLLNVVKDNFEEYVMAASETVCCCHRLCNPFNNTYRHTSIVLYKLNIHCKLLRKDCGTKEHTHLQTPVG